MKQDSKAKRTRALTLRPGAAVYAVLWAYALIMTQLLKNPASAVFFWFMVLVLPVSFLAMIISYACVQIYVFTDRSAAEKLSPVQYEVRIINSSPLPIPFAEAITVLPQESGVRCVKERLVLSLPPFGGYSVKTDVRFRYRGIYEIGVSEVYIYDPLRIFRIRKKINNYSNVTVLPRTLETDFGEQRAVSDFPSPASSSVSTREAAETANIREYRAGDPLKSIHWKLSSKAEELQVRDFNTNDDRQTYILIDFAAPTPPPQSEGEKVKGKLSLRSRRAAAKAVSDEDGNGEENPKIDKKRPSPVKKLREKTAKILSDAKARREKRRYMRFRAKGVSAADIEAASMIDALIKETSGKSKKKNVKTAGISTAESVSDTVAAEQAARTDGTENDKKQDISSASSNIASASRTAPVPDEKNRLDTDQWGGAVKADFEDEMPEYCADGVADIASSLLMKELKSGSRCTVLWYDSREEKGFAHTLAATVADFEGAYSRFACAPVVPAENRVSRLADFVSAAQNITVKIVTANLDPINVSQYCTVPSRFGGAGTGCRTEVLLFNPEEKYASPVSRLRYADSCRLLLRQFGIVMREVEETDGTDGRPHLRDKNTP